MVTRMDMTGVLNDAEMAWYNELTDENYQQLEEGYLKKVSGRRVIGNIGFPAFVKICAGVGIKLQARQDRKERKAFEKLERLGNRK